MKYITILLVVFILVGCIGRSYNGRKFDFYIELNKANRDSFDCAEKCGNLDGMKRWLGIIQKTSDSVHKYYNLMYPNGNPSDREEDKKETNCNCK